MSDEFPTLEVTLAASVVVLLWRGWLLRRSRLGFISASERLLAAFRHGPPSVRQLSAANLDHFLEPLARAAVTAHVDDTPRAVTDRARRVRRGVRSAAARDLVICAVLVGSLAYILIANIAVGWTFYVLGASATLLLMLAVLERVRLDRELARVSAAFALVVSHLGRGDGSRETPACRICGEPYRERLASAAELGPRLWELGAREIFACGRCGHVTGKIPLGK